MREAICINEKADYYGTTYLNNYKRAIYFDNLSQNLKKKVGVHLIGLLEDNNNLPTSGIR